MFSSDSWPLYLLILATYIWCITSDSPRVVKPIVPIIMPCTEIQLQFPSFKGYHWFDERKELSSIGEYFGCFKDVLAVIY